ncbi:MAG: VOC family protein [Proteobacteria bacterium]|nr:VOC family protein [Pseudomonadota bacterium]
MAAGDAANLKFEPGKPAASFKREGFHTLTPVIRVKDAGAAIEFYKAALGAEELNRMPMPDGRIMHAEIKIGDSVLMISDEMPEYGSKSPVTLGGTPFALMVYVDDVDTAFALAVKAGAKAKQPVMDQFWGDRYGEIEDPSGHRWGLATHKENLTPDQISERMKKQYAGPQGEHKPGEHQK